MYHLADQQASRLASFSKSFPHSSRKDDSKSPEGLNIKKVKLGDTRFLANNSDDSTVEPGCL